MNTTIQKYITESEYHTIGYDIRNAKPHHDKSIEILQFWSEGGHFISRNNFFPIKPGVIVLISGTELHYSNPVNVSKYNRSKLIITTECFDKICSLCNFEQLSKQLYSSGGYMLPLTQTDNRVKIADALFKKAAQCLTRKEALPTDQASIIDCVIQILSLFAESDSLSIDNIVPENITLKMMQYINNQLLSWENITLNDLCEELHISPSYAAHMFKRLTNKSITQYAMDLRISEAKKLLLTTDLKVAHIAEKLYFKDSTTFCKTFKKCTGYTPRTYKITEGVVSSNPIE